MLRQLVDLVQRLNLAYPQSFIGEHFPEIISLLSIVFGGSFLLFAWKQRAYFLGITGFLVGGWAGLLFKAFFLPDGAMSPFLYLGICAVAGAYLAISLQRFVGMLLGGFTAGLLLYVLNPGTLHPEQASLATICMAFLLGGGLGALFPKFFFVFNCSLIGAAFATYGVSQAILRTVATGASPELMTFLHIVVFLPLFLFGIAYQMAGADSAPVPAPALNPLR
ncbi:MAG: hypothetical protein ACYTAF_02790 [Planctomycetota bacterium]|jgi:hypothetical protein